MEARTIGIREFRERLADYLLKNDRPIAITRHGVTIGYFIPARAAGTELEKVSLRAAAARVGELLEHADAGGETARKRKSKSRRR
jgi:antitoxin (DNA-binding transcriptional repressor) of toxin-antitoxin stability system